MGSLEWVVFFEYELISMMNIILWVGIHAFKKER